MKRVLDVGYVIVDTTGYHHLSKNGIYHSADKAQKVCDKENSIIYKDAPVFHAVSKVELVAVDYEEVEEKFKKLAEELAKEEDNG